MAFGGGRLARRQALARRGVMNGTPPPPNPRQLLAQAGMGAKKSWGQNFLLDQEVLAQMAEASGAGPEQPVVELGAGLGALTYHLLRLGGRVVAIERDRELAPLLRSALAWAPSLDVREADAARLSYADLASELGGPLVVVGNLPYQLSSRILVTLADAAASVRRVVVLVQEEVADRLCAPAGSRAYGLLSVLVQRSLAPEPLWRVPPTAFLPRPKVVSRVVRLESRGAARTERADAVLVQAARAAFSARRKTLRNALKGALGVEAAATEAAIEAAGLSPQARAETLSVADFARLGKVLEAAGLLSVGPRPNINRSP